MTIRKKTILIVTGTALALLLALYVAGRRIILDAALDLEREDVSLDLSRVFGELEAATDRLWRINGDWAAWNDTYEFVKDRNEEYAKDNLTDVVIGNLGLVGVIYLDLEGRVVTEKFVTPADEAQGRLFRELSGFVAANPEVIAPGTRRVGGLLPFARGTFLLAARPIVHSDQSGPPRGTLVFAQWLDIAEVARTARLGHLETALYPIGAARAPATVRGGRYGGPPPVVIVPRGSLVVAGITRVEDILGRPSLALEVAVPRTIYANGVRSLRYFIGALGLAVVCFGLLVSALLERLVLSRLSRLSADVHGIGGDADPTHRVAVSGNDEIALLGTEVNGMLARLVRAHADLRRSHEVLEERVRERTTELERATAELERQNRELRAVDRMKDALIGDVSHELRTPVAKQAMQLELLRDGLERRGLDGEFAGMLGVMDGAVRRQQNVIRNILTMSRLENGGRKVELGDFRLDELIAEIVDYYSGLTQSCAIAVATDVPSVVLHTDRELLWHVLSNLVGNAVKFRGPAAPRIEITGSTGDGRVRLRVADNGVGFPPEMREHLFERFFQRSASADGIGLGLNIARKSLALIGGEVTLESPGPGLGAVAEVILPLEAPSPLERAG